MMKIQLATLLLALLLLYGCTQQGKEQATGTPKTGPTNEQTEQITTTGIPQQETESAFQELEQFSSADITVEELDQEMADFEFNESQLG